MITFSSFSHNFWFFLKFAMSSFFFFIASCSLNFWQSLPTAPQKLFKIALSTVYYTLRLVRSCIDPLFILRMLPGALCPAQIWPSHAVGLCCTSATPGFPSVFVLQLSSAPSFVWNFRNLLGLPWINFFVAPSSVFWGIFQKERGVGGMGMSFFSTIWKVKMLFSFLFVINMGERFCVFV